MGDLHAQGLANIAWAFSIAGQSNVELSMALARVVEQRLGDFSEQNLSNTA